MSGAEKSGNSNLPSQIAGILFSAQHHLAVNRTRIVLSIQRPAQETSITSIIGISAASGATLFIVVAIEHSLGLLRNGDLFLPGFLFSAIWSVASWQTYLKTISTH
ncbi:hypothetical protein N8214_05570 [Pseudomonadales bacterium]|nr:hypothetical protein [Gammaproteobacteria bacterium]MDC1478863.1 hypothetical protein [Pseudomonadales bacterium]